MADGRRMGEAALVIVAVFALLLSAALLPSISLFENSRLPGELPGDAAPEIPDGLSDAGRPQGQPGGQGQLPDIGAPGQFAGGSLSEPPEQTQISGQLSGTSRVPLFKIESPVNTYWRQTAYSTYTGTGWEQDVERQSLDSGVPNDALTSDDTRFEYRVTLLQGGRSLPTAWQPESVQLEGGSSDAELRVSTVGGVQSQQSLSEGTTYVAESAAPTRDPNALRAANGRGPPAVQETYTQLPLGTDDRIETFTDDLVADDDFRYERAKTVEQWLKTNREYSLNTSIDPSKPIAEQLLFEVDAAYCQQFATTMAVMLRSQDIPARYVVGFASGTPVGDEEYLVTSDRAHAWVEVYFDDVGWVRFDPTPAGDLQVASPEPPYDLSLNRSAVVGAPVSVSVTKNDSAVSAIPVYVNDERVGWTDADGTVETTLPYADEVTIRAGEGRSETKYSDGSDTGSESERNDAAVESLSLGNDRSVANTATTGVDIESETGDHQPGTGFRAPAPGYEPTAASVVPRTTATPPGVAQASGGESGDSMAIYPLESNATVEVVGEPTVGGTATVVATVGNVPVTDATVSLDGTQVGTTGDDGSYELSLDNVTAGSHQVSVIRPPVQTATTFTVAQSNDDGGGNEDGDDEDDDSRLEPNVSVTPATGIALPGVPATANVSRFGSPISGTTVRVDGESVGTTDANGTVNFTLPIKGSVSVAATVTGVRGETQLTDLYRNAGVVLAVLIGTVGGIVVYARRHGVTRETVRATLAAVGGRLRRLPGRVMAAVIRLAGGIETAAKKLIRRLRSWRAVFSASLSDLRAWLDPRSVFRAARALLRDQLQQLRQLFRRESETTEETTTAATAEQRTVRSLWGSFVAVVRPPRLSTRTPVEIGQYAVDRGFPEKPVQYLTAMYRAVEYGRESPDDSRLDRARDALSEIRATEDED